MSSPQLAVYLAARSLLYFRHVLHYIPCGEVDILVPPPLCPPNARPCPALEELRGRGHTIRSVENARGPYGALAVAGYPDLENNPHLVTLAQQRILMLHATTFQPLFRRQEFSHVLCMHENQARSMAGPDNTLSNATGRREFAYAGLYQLGEWENRRHEDKARLRLELQRQGICVPSNKKLILYCGGLLDNPLEQCQAVLHLSRNYFVIFKPYYFLPQHEVLLRLSSVAVIQDTVSISPDAMRFAADFILTSPLSGVFTTSLLLGLQVLPLLTCHQALAEQRETFVHWSTLLHGDSPELCLAKAAGGPYDTSQLLQLEGRLASPDFWQKYDACLPHAQKKAFGAYGIEGTAARAARLLLRVALRGTFGEDTALTRPYTPLCI